MREYHKYLQPFWIEQEREIEDFFNRNPISDYDKCKEIIHGMIVKNGMPATMQVQGFHYINYELTTKKKIKDMKSIVEIGGGYGIMCRLIRTLNDCLYTIIDIPIINKLQQYILRNDFNINYYGIDKIENMTFLDHDMFISLYALSESSPEMIEYVLDKKLFNAKNVLMCFQKKDDPAFIFNKYIDRFKEYGEVMNMDSETFYLIR